MSASLPLLALSSAIVIATLCRAAPCAAQSEAPAEARAIAAALMAHHPEDLPRSWPASAAPTLRWLAGHHTLMVVRMRALQALHGDASRETRALLLSVMADRRAGVSMRASAVIGSRSLPLDPDLRAALRAAATVSPVIAEAVTRRGGMLPRRHGASPAGGARQDSVR